MTARTHDLFAFTGLTLFLTLGTLPPMSFATALAAFGTIFLGGLAPDLDEPSAELWRRIPAGSIIGRIVSPLLGSHRFISHSILGLFVIGYGMKFFLGVLSTIVLIDMNVIWWAFMSGVMSHIVADMLTREGVPLLFPINWKFGIPPFRFLRIKTGGMVEKTIVFPTLLICNGYLYYIQYAHVFTQLKSLVK